MIIVKLMGGLGNQMFQYAFGKHLALVHQTDLLVDLGFLLDRSPKKLFVYRDFDLTIFDLVFRVAEREDFCPFNIQRESPLTRFKRIRRQKKIRHFFPEKYYRITEASFSFDSTYLNLPKNTYLEGFWQSEKYFKNSEKQIRNCFKFKHELNEDARQIAEHIKTVNAVCINVRRGYV